MKNKYTIRQSEFAGLTFFEIRGESFSCEELYQIVGKHQFMSTFIFKKDSDASIRFCQYVTGVIFYSRDELYSFETCNEKEMGRSDRRVKIDAAMPDLTIEKREDLKYRGVLATDIERILFTGYNRAEERHESGEKKIPNIIYIPYENDPKVDCDILYQNFILTKIRSKTELIQYEKEKFIGITLAINNGRIDSRLLKYFGFDLEKVKSCQNIWYHVYKVKERRKRISDDEKSKLIDIETIRQLEYIGKILKEIMASKVNAEEISEKKPLFKTILSSMSRFEPSILLYGKKQIYWDIDSYIHIVLRHVKQLQIGTFKHKSAFSYKLEDLEALIDKVLGSIKDEINRHYESRPGKGFKRVGKMSVLFNGDYYCVQIDENGRLINFYMN